MSTPPWMPLYIGDYRADTTHLNAAQHGAYLLLIMHYWQQGGLPDDDEQLARIACMSLAEWRRNRPVLRAFFSEGWRHARVDLEIADAIKRYERRAKAAERAILPAGGLAMRSHWDRNHNHPHIHYVEVLSREKRSQKEPLGVMPTKPTPARLLPRRMAVALP